MSDEANKGLLSPLRRKLLMGMAAVPAITMLPRASFAQAPATSAVNTTGPRGHRHRGDRRPSALRHRHHGDQRDRLDPGRAARHRPDQRHRRHPRPQDQDHPGGRRQRLADLRREGQEAARQRQGRRRLRLLDLGLAQGRAAGLREGERPALLPDLLRGPRAVEERDLHRPGGDAADHRRPGLGRQGEGRQDLLPDRLRLHLAAHLEQDRAQAHRERAEGHGRRRGVLPARPHPVRLAHQQDQAAEAGRHLRRSSSAAATSPSTSS